MKTRRPAAVVSIFLALLLVILSLTTACPKPAPGEKTLDIGVLVALTGDGSDVGIMLRDGTLLAADWLNDKGGININGQKYLINLLIEDNKGSVEGTVSAATKLVEQDKVKFMLGPTLPHTDAAAEQVTGPAQVLRCMNIGIGLPGETSPDRPYHFNAFVGIGWTHGAVYDYLVEAYPAVRTVAFVGADDPGAHYFADRSKEEAEKRGLTMVAAEFYPWGTNDFYPVLTKILATKPDCVDLGAQMVQLAGAMFKQLRELGFTGPCFNVSSNDCYSIRDIIGKTAATEYFNTSVDVGSPEMTPMLKEVAKLWQDKYGTSFQGQTDGLFGWDSLWCMTQAIEEAQSLDPVQVTKTWEKMTSIETLRGPGKMGGEKTFGINHVVVTPIPMTRLNNGEVEFIGWRPLEIP